MSTQPAPQPGWYPDPGGQGQRYWNGVAWGPIAPPWQPMPPAAPSPQPKRRGVGWLIVVGVLILCPGSCIYGLVSHDDKSARSNTTTSSRTASTPAFSAPTTSVKPAARIGQQVRDGKFAFEVHNAKFCTVVWKDRRNFTPRGILKQYKIEREQ